MPSFILTDNELSIVIDNTPYTVEREHPKFSEIISAVKEARWSDIPELISVAKALQVFGEGKVEVDEDEGVIRYEGRVLNNVLTNRILWMMNDGFNIDPFVKFVENLMSNPSKRAVDELYTFLEYGKLPITEDGYFLAYKRVRANYMDVYTGKINNSVGQYVTMERRMVDDRSEVTCSDGLHFCSLEYLKHFSGERVVILKINPRDVVSIPVDYNNTKGRCCGYEVVGEYKGLMTDPAFNKSVYLGSEDGSEDLDIDFEDQDDEGDVTQDYIEGYVSGHRDGRNRVEATFLEQDLLDDDTYDEDDYGRGYVDGYKDGKGHKARQYTN